MKKLICMILTVVILLSCMIVGSPAVYAAQKETTSRAIAIVFDNSRSMYMKQNLAWCRAIYAMEVFASMLNDGDVLEIYPMYPITIAKEGKEEYYFGDNKNPDKQAKPLVITSPSDSKKIRDIFSVEPKSTPIECIDAAAKGLEKSKADEKYLIVLTDGTSFTKYNEKNNNNPEMSKEQSIKELDKRFEEQIQKGITVMYLGMDRKETNEEAIMPTVLDSDKAIKATDSKAVLTSLTKMCNAIFGRNTLPSNHISGKTIDFDISISKLIVFVQGTNIDNLKITGTTGTVGTKVSAISTKYGTQGAGNEESIPDTSLQGMMVTYTDCSAGTYNIEFTGTATSIEVYYEPDADLDFVFTDADGNNVDPESLYEGEYTVSFGMKDAKTGELISSDLLGNPHYQGSYYRNGKEYSITHDGYQGEESVTLEMGDTFDANLTVTYLDGYTIRKDSSEFGWPEFGITVEARPAGDLRIEITGGDKVYSLQDLQTGEPYILKVYYKGTQLVGEDLRNIELSWDADKSNAKITSEFAEDHYILTLGYMDPATPETTKTGECKVPVTVKYTEKGSDPAEAKAPLVYKIDEDTALFGINVYAPEDYIVIKELADSKAVVVELELNNQKLPAEEFNAVAIQVECNGINYTVTPLESDSKYLIQLESTEGLSEGDYYINVTAKYTDKIGRVTEASDTAIVTLSTTPLWLKWLFWILIILLIITIILLILHIKALPSYAHVNKQKDSTIILDGEDKKKTASLDAEIKKGQMTVSSKLGGPQFGFSLDVKPGEGSYVKTPQTQRTAEASPSIRKFGTAKIRQISIGASVKYVLDEETNRLVRTPKSNKPFTVKHGSQIVMAGTIPSGGQQKDFYIKTKLDFKKK